MQSLRHLPGIALMLFLGAIVPGPVAAQECQVELREQSSGLVADGSTLCQTASPKKCVFQLSVCANSAGCTAADLKHKAIRAKGRCVPGKLKVKGNGTSSVCSAFVGVKVKTKKRGKKEGTCRVKAKAGADTDTITLSCRPTTDPCPTTTTTTPVTTTTTTTLRCGNGILDSGEVCDPPGSQGQCAAGQACNSDCSACAQVSCDPIVPGSPIAGTYNIQDVMGPKVCTQGASANALGACQSDADCGGDTGACVQTPWISAGGITLPFPLGISATYTVASEDSPPTCSHQACIVCGDPAATCPGLTGCNGGNPKCINSPAVCCSTPGFIVPTFFLSSLGTCVKVDQKACGSGVVNTSNPQTGDNEVIKSGDSSDPGPDCAYGTPDDPAAKPCTTTAGGAGADNKGKVVRTLGNGTPDSSGIHSRFLVSIMATAWTDTQGCPPGATFDVGEIALTQLILNAELSTAGATAGFADMNGDGCALPTGALGFGGGNVGPITLGPPTLTPAPYGGGTNIMGAAGLVFPGSGPTFDLGFIGVVPFSAPTVATPQACTCSPAAGCPE